METPKKVNPVKRNWVVGILLWPFNTIFSRILWPTALFNREQVAKPPTPSGKWGLGRAHFTPTLNGQRFSILLFWLLGLFGACRPNQSLDTPPARSPVVLVIGHDVSQTFKGNAQLTEPILDSLLSAVAQSELSATVAYDYIGNPGEHSFLRCTLQAIPSVDVTLALNQLVVARREQLRIKQLNRQAIDAFLLQYQQLNSLKLHEKTDLNAFFRKASKLLAEAQFDGYHKYILVNSDGIHDLGDGKPLQCDWPAQTTVCLSGWAQPQRLCTGNTPLSFESIEGFQGYIHKKLANHEL